MSGKRLKSHAVAVAIAAASLLWCANVEAADTVRIPVVLSLSGPAAFLGQGERQTLKFVEATVNGSGGIDGRQLHFDFRDDESNPQTAVQLTSGLIADKPPILLGSSLTAACRAMAPLMKEGPVQYCLSPGFHPEKGSYSYSANVSTLDVTEAQIRYFRLKGWRRIAAIVSTDATGQDAEASIKQILGRPENKDMHLVSLEHFNPTDLSVAAQIETLKAAKPQALIAWSTGAPIATVFRGMTESGFSLPTMTTAANMTYTQMERYSTFLPKVLYFPVSSWVIRDPRSEPETAQARAAFYRAYKLGGKRPDGSSELSWDPGMLAVAALRKFGPEATAQEVQNFLQHLDGFSGVDGIFNFIKAPQRGLDVSDSVVTRWDPKTEAWTAVSKPGGDPLDR